MRILGIETSCDETAAAVVEAGTRVLSSIVASQQEVHEQFGGVVPEVACRAHVEAVLPVIRRALEVAAVPIDRIDAVAVTTTPGLIGALLVGVTAAKSLSWALDVPLVAVNHLHAHAYAAWLSDEPPELPAVTLVVSGGHTSLFRTDGPIEHSLLGSTVDDAAGEAFDKVAHILGLGYPGGPAIERAAAGGRPDAVSFPRSMLRSGNANFSFSGLKTAVLYHCVGPNASREDIEGAVYEPSFVADVAAAFQEAVVDVLAAKACAAARQEGVRTLIVGGGVAANGRLRERLAAEADALGLALRLAPRRLCTDNAAMIAGVACPMLRAGRTAPLTVEAVP